MTRTNDLWYGRFGFGLARVVSTSPWPIVGCSIVEYETVDGVRRKMLGRKFLYYYQRLGKWNEPFTSWVDIRKAMKDARLSIQ